MRKESEEKRKKEEGESRFLHRGLEPLESTTDESFTIKKLIDIVKNKYPVLGEKAVKMLEEAARKGQGINEGIQKLTELLGDEDRYVGEMVVWVLREIAAQGNEEAMKVLMKALENEDEVVKWEALRALGEVAANGYDISKAIPQLIKLLGDEDRYVKWKAVWVLGEIAAQGNEEAMKVLMKALENENPGIRRRAALALGYVAGNGYNISEAVPKLIELLKDNNRNVKEAARLCLNMLLRIDRM